MSETVTADLIRALIENMAPAPVDWESFSMIIDVDEGVFSAHGYTYSPDDTITAVAVRASTVRSAADDYFASHYAPGDTLPVQTLVQFERASGRYDITFEDTDRDRWKMSPANVRTFRQGLRPQFD